MNSKNRAVVFTDIHWGEGINDPKKIEIAKNNIQFIIDSGKQNNADYCIFCGDWFHSRNSLLVSTQDTSYLALKELVSAFKKVYLIVGNHDTFLKHSVEIHSLRAFESISAIIDKATEITIANKSILLHPWGFNPDIYNKSFDYAFGHFEPNGAELVGSLSSGANYDLNKLSNIANKVFSGHFHKRKVYKIADTREVIMVGSPSEQNWGEIGYKHGCYVIDFENDSYDFIENIEAPKHKVIYWSDIKKKNFPNKLDITNNFINLVIDDEYEFENIIKFKQKLLNTQPIEIGDEYTYTGTIELNNQTTKSVDDLKTRTDYIIIHIDNLKEIPDKIDIDKLKSMAISIYNNAEKELIGEDLVDE